MKQQNKPHNHGMEYNGKYMGCTACSDMYKRQNKPHNQSGWNILDQVKFINDLFAMDIFTDWLKQHDKQIIQEERIKVFEKFSNQWIDIENGFFHLCYRIENGQAHLTCQKNMTHNKCKYCQSKL